MWCVRKQRSFYSFIVYTEINALPYLWLLGAL